MQHCSAERGTLAHDVAIDPATQYDAERGLPAHPAVTLQYSVQHFPTLSPTPAQVAVWVGRPV